MIIQSIDSVRIFKQQLKSQLQLVNFYVVLAQFQIKIARFSLVLTTHVLFCTQIVVLKTITPFSSQFF